MDKTEISYKYLYPLYDRYVEEHQDLPQNQTKFLEYLDDFRDEFPSLGLPIVPAMQKALAGKRRNIFKYKKDGHTYENFIEKKQNKPIFNASAHLKNCKK